MRSAYRHELRAFYPSLLSLAAIVLMSLVPFDVPIALAQSTSSGTVSGQVTDSQDAVVVGAVAVLTDISTNAERSTITNEVGRYLFLNVPPGVYTLTVSKAGFTRARLSDQNVQVGLVLTLNIKLEIGSTTSFVEVKAGAGAELQTTNATVGTTITGAPLNALPNLGRDANSFFVLQPAVAPGGQVSGAGNDQTLFQLDGGNNSSDQDGNYANYTASSGFMGSGTGGSPSGRDPYPGRKHRGVQGRHQQPDRRLQRRRRRPGADGHQARRQPVSRLGLRILFRQ